MKFYQQNLLPQLQEKVQQQHYLKCLSQELQNKLIQVNLNKQQKKQKLIKVLFRIDQFSIIKTDKQRKSFEQKTCQKVTMENQVDDLFQQRLTININKSKIQYNTSKRCSRQKSKMIEKMKLLKIIFNTINSDCNYQITKNSHRLNQLYFELQDKQQLIQVFLEKNLLFGNLRQDLNLIIQNFKQKQVSLIDEIKSVQCMINELEKTQIQQIIESHDFEELKRI
ncbi:hypothetical protein pb186bvf_002212 [Paramecium bursaria]